ncbi:MAG: hypothetical protein WBR33_19775 [Pseudonocardiaceae bacterium]
MTLSVRVVLYADDGTETVVCDREPLTLDSLGLGLGEAKDLLAAVQSALVTEQVNAGVAAQVACPHCGRPGQHKGQTPHPPARGRRWRVRCSLVGPHWRGNRLPDVCYHPGLVWISPLGRRYHTQPPPIIHDLPEPRPRPIDVDYLPVATLEDDTPILERPPPQPEPALPPTLPDPHEPLPF